MQALRMFFKSQFMVFGMFGIYRKYRYYAPNNSYANRERTLDTRIMYKIKGNFPFDCQATIV